MISHLMPRYLTLGLNMEPTFVCIETISQKQVNS